MRDDVWGAVKACMLLAALPLAQRGGTALPQGDATPQTQRAAQLTGLDKPGEGLKAIAPIFDRLGGKALQNAWLPGDGGDMPKEGKFGAELTKEYYKAAAEKLKEPLQKAIDAKDADALLDLCEGALQRLPLCPGDAEKGDISLYDSGKLAAALASCFTLAGEGAQNGENAQELLLFSCDFSGIQKFIYRIAESKALRMLRSRSFFLELVMETSVTALLTQCGLTRANCIYSGGGHAYLLLPNTQQTVDAIQQFDKDINKWLAQSYGAELFLACAFQPCTPEQLMGKEGGEAYRSIFRELSSKISSRKLHRYTADALREINAPQLQSSECKVCGRQARSGGYCPQCKALIDLAEDLFTKDTVFAVTDIKDDKSLELAPIGGKRWLKVIKGDDAAKCAQDEHYIHFYYKNSRENPLPRSTRLYAADWRSTTLMDELEKTSSGIKRIGVFRADVDNLGQAFSAGFEVEGDKSPSASKYSGLMRTASLSRSLNIFFKKYLNDILKAQQGSTMVVYSGGDDMFIVGAWDAAIKAAQTLHKAFEAYTGGVLTFSGGVGLYSSHYPIARAAQETEQLEDFAKHLPATEHERGKDAITLFHAEEGMRFKWQKFTDNVMGEKYAVIESFFSTETGEEQERGAAFLYRVMYYLRQIKQGGKINLARCAYLLARMEPKDAAAAAKYQEFSKNVFKWALNETDRNQLIAAIYIYVYMHRNAS